MIESRLRHAIALVGAAVLVLATAGCAAPTPAVPSPSPSPTPRFSLSPEQREAVDDGMITRDEYDAGFRRYEACMAQLGFALVDVREEFQVITYSITDEAVVSGADEECYNAEFVRIDSAWQVRVEDQGEEAQQLGLCLSNAGLDAGGTKNEKTRRLEDAGITIDECLDSLE